MEIVKQNIITDEDYNMLRGYIPDNPCNSCGVGMGCCGCDKETNYRQIIKKYKDNNLFEPMICVKHIRDSIDKINKEQSIIMENYSKLASLGFKPDKLFDNLNISTK